MYKSWAAVAFSTLEETCDSDGDDNEDVVETEGSNVSVELTTSTLTSASEVKPNSRVFLSRMKFLWISFSLLFSMAPRTRFYTEIFRQKEIYE